MKILQYVALILLLWGIPSFFSYEESIGSKFSYLTIGVLVIYYFLSTKRRVVIPFLALGILYFAISGLVYLAGDPKFFRNDLIKYLVLVICGAELARNTTKKELFIVLLLGSCSIFVHALFFQTGFGRYSGLYLDPNGAGFACIFAYCLSFRIQPKQLKLIGQFIVTLAGILTFSRTFIILWLIVSLISVLSDRKNSLNFGLGIGALVVVFTIGSLLKVDAVRFNALSNLVNDSNSTSTVAAIKRDSRLKTWSRYYDDILDNPVFGTGYRQLGGADEIRQGVHNSYLMVIGESGIFPFLIFVGIYTFMFIKSLRNYKREEFKLMLSSTLLAILMTTHNYFDNYLLLFVSLWLFIQLTEYPLNENDTIELDESQLINSKL